jgi:hypothetical protein
MTTPKNIYQIKVTLDDSKPPIWRRLLVKDATTLGQLHTILQIAMGWEDYHLHMFTLGQEIYGNPEYDETGEFGTKDEKRYRLNQFVNREGFKFRYEYDFGDSWDHTLLVEKILPAEKGVRYPVCTTGKRACPPEDVGGVWGYEDFLQAIASPKHEEHDSYLEWIGGKFDPEEFDVTEVNEALHHFNRRVREELENPPLSEGVEQKLNKLITWTQSLTGKQLKQFDSLPLRRDMLTFLNYLLENRTVGTQSTGNLPLKAVRAICGQFVHPPALEETIGDHTFRLRSEEDVRSLFFIHTLAHASNMVIGGAARIWQVTDEGQKFLQLPGVINIFFLLATWWEAVDWRMNFPYTGFSNGLPAGFNMKVLACLLKLPVGQMFSYEAFADNLIKESRLIWPIDDQVSARNILHSAINRMVIVPLVMFGVLERRDGKKKIGEYTIDELTSIRLTPTGKGMLGLLE